MCQYDSGRVALLTFNAATTAGAKKRLVLLAQAVAGLSGTSATTPPATKPAVATAPPTTVSFDGQVGYKDDQGYTYTISYNLEFGPPSQSDTNASPGYTDVLLPETGTVTVTNTTSGGRTALAIASGELEEFFPSTSTICNYVLGNNQAPVKLTQPTGTYCQVYVSQLVELNSEGVESIGPASLAAGASYTGTDVPSSQSSPLLNQVAERDYPAIAKAILAPPIIALVAQAQDYPSGPQTPSTACNAQGFYVFVSKPAITCSTVPVNQ